MHTFRRRVRLAREKKCKRKTHQRFRQRIFERDRNAELSECHLPRIVVLTGTSIFAESGINTFRAADGCWEGHKVEDVAMPEGFFLDPQRKQAFYNLHRRQFQQSEIQPNAAHKTRVELESVLGDNFLLVTQNIDNLHERADSARVIHMHGELLKVCCSVCGQIFDWIKDTTLSDHCQYCSQPYPHPLCPHIVGFDEIPLEMKKPIIPLKISIILLK